MQANGWAAPFSSRSTASGGAPGAKRRASPRTPVVRPRHVEARERALRIGGAGPYAGRTGVVAPSPTTVVQGRTRQPVTRPWRT